ncbi:MAG TPA: helix-hairpin-helix domain-containing protein [Gammaproteobacteria bacterium]
MAVKGVGEKRAEAIIAFREQNGPFKSVDDLLLVKGVGQAIVDDNRDTLSTSE